MSIPILSLITFLPLAGALLLIFLPKENKRLLYGIALFLSLTTFLISLVLYFGFDAQAAGPQFVEKTGWLGFGIQYHLGIDGISLFLVLLTTLVVSFVVSGGRSAWYAGVQLLSVYAIFAVVTFLFPN